MDKLLRSIRMKQLAVWMILVVVVCTACDHRKKSKEAWLTLSPLPPKSELPYFLLIEEGNNVQIDTLEVKESNIALQLLPDTVGIAHLFNNKREKICSFYAHESAKVSLKKEGSYYRFEGDSINRLLFDYYRSVEVAHSEKGKALRLAEAQLRKGTKDSIWTLIAAPKLYSQDSMFRVATERFIAANATLPIALIAFDHYNDQSIFTPAAYSWLKPLTKELLQHPCFDDPIKASEKLVALAPDATLSFSSFVDLKGKPYAEGKEKRKRLVCFWDPDDSVSVVAHKAFARKFVGKEQKGYDYFGVSLNGNKEIVEKCLSKERIGGTQLLTEGAHTNAKRNGYGIASTPYCVLLDTNSRVISAGIYPIQFERLLKKGKASVTK